MAFVAVPSRQIRIQYLKLFAVLVVLISFCVSLSLFKYHTWFIEDQKEELAHDAFVSNAILEDVLVDATKLLDQSKPYFEGLIDKNQLTDQAAHQILNKSHLIFNRFITNNRDGLTVYADEKGIVRATNQGVTQNKIDVSERLYFKTLKNNPNLSYAVGSLVIGYTNGIPVFHIATPLVNHQGKFCGLLTQQISATSLAITLEKTIQLSGGSKVEVFDRFDGDHLSFVYPLTSDVKGLRVNLDASKVPLKKQEKFGYLELPASHNYPERSYVGYAVTSNFDLVTLVYQPSSSLEAIFLRRCIWMLGLYILLLLGSAAIIYLFYRNAIIVANSTFLSMTDKLTGIKNRRAFDVEFDRLWKNSVRTHEPISVLFLDIDHFKNFNDTYGHDCGDIALQQLAKTIENLVTRPLDVFCRWGGEEFVIVLPNTDQDGAISLADKILKAVREIKLSFACNKNQVITVSIGVATLVGNQNNKTDDLVDMADKAMYRAKQAGRDCYKIYS